MSSHLSQVPFSSHQYLSQIHSFTHSNITYIYKIQIYISSHFISSLYNTFPASISSHLFQITLSSHQIPLPNAFIHSFKYLSHLISLKYLSSIHLISSLPNTSHISSNISSKFIHSLIQISLYSHLFSFQCLHNTLMAKTLILSPLSKPFIHFYKSIPPHIFFFFM